MLPLLPDAQRVWKARHVLPSAEEVVALATHLAVKYGLSFVILEQTAMRVSESSRWNATLTMPPVCGHERHL